MAIFAASTGQEGALAKSLAKCQHRHITGPSQKAQKSEHCGPKADSNAPHYADQRHRVEHSLKVTWPARAPRGLSLMELAKVARDFGREDLYEVFTGELDEQLELLGPGGPIDPVAPLEIALARIYHWAHMPRAERASKAQGRREYQKALKAIVAGHAAFVREIAKCRLSGWDASEAQELQIEIEEMEDREERRHD